MSYSFTEKKRIRKSFAKRASVLPIPFLLATQLESYAAFLQEHVPATQRENRGLQAAFSSIFPIALQQGKGLSGYQYVDLRFENQVIVKERS